MKRFYIYTLIISIMAVFAVSGCSGDSSSNSSGGAGADFDATQYYTKTEIDSMLLDVVQSGGGGGPLTASNVGYDNGLTLTVPAGATGALVKITGYNTSGSAQVIGISAGYAATGGGVVFHGKLNTDYDMVMGYVSFGAGTTDFRIWYNTGLGGAEYFNFTQCTLYVEPVAWFK